jgi:SAM-dependent methyltransferase
VEDGRDKAKATVAASYDRIAERHAIWAASVRKEERARFTALLIDACPRGASLLELGCGTAGATTQALAGHFELTGVDISARSIEIARRVLPSAEFICADMTLLSLPPVSFDTVAAFYSLIHVPREELVGLFGRVFSWLKPGGLFVATLNGSDTAGSYETDWLGVPMFWSGYDPATARRLVEDVGFRVDALTLETAVEGFAEPSSFWWLVARRPHSRLPDDR